MSFLRFIYLSFFLCPPLVSNEISHVVYTFFFPHHHWFLLFHCDSNCRPSASTLLPARRRHEGCGVACVVETDLERSRWWWYSLDFRIGFAGGIRVVAVVVVVVVVVVVQVLMPVVEALLLILKLEVVAVEEGGAFVIDMRSVSERVFGWCVGKRRFITCSGFAGIGGGGLYIC